MKATNEMIKNGGEWIKERLKVGQRPKIGRIKLIVTLYKLKVRRVSARTTKLITLIC